MLYLSDQTKIALAKSSSADREDRGGDGIGHDPMDEDDDDEEDIMALLDSGNSEQRQSGHKGLVFYQRFAKVLDSYFCRNFGEFTKCILERIGSGRDESEQRQLMLILTTVLKHVIDESSTAETGKSKEEKQAFLTNLMAQFAAKSILDTVNEENVRQILSIIRHFLVQCDSAVVLGDGNSKYSEIAKYIKATYAEALQNAKHENAQLEAIKMLPLFIVDPDRLSPWLLQAIHEMISFSFPNSSKEAYERSKTEWRDYVEKSESILDTVIVSQSIELLKVSMPLFREKDHKNKVSMEEKLDRFIGTITAPLKQQQCLKILSQAVELSVMCWTL